MSSILIVGTSFAQVFNHGTVKVCSDLAIHLEVETEHFQLCQSYVERILLELELIVFVALQHVLVLWLFLVLSGFVGQCGWLSHFLNDLAILVPKGGVFFLFKLLFEVVESHQKTRKLFDLFVLLCTVFFVFALESHLFDALLLVLLLQSSDVCGKRENLGVFVRLVRVDLLLLLLDLLVHVVQFLLQQGLTIGENLVTIEDVVDLSKLVAVSITYFFQEGIILLHCLLLLFDAFRLFIEDFVQSCLSLNFFILALVFFF